MDGYVEQLCYSEKQLELNRKHGGEAMVILVDGAEKPVLATETIDNMPPLTCMMEDTLVIMDSNRDPVTLKSHWDDAIIVVTSTGKGYQRLVNGLNEVTNAGKAWCASQGLEPTPEAVRAVAQTPRRTMGALRLKSKP
jgi:hypothetical protein